LGTLLGLPIPHFCIAEVPNELVQDSGRSDINDLGAGLVFASQLVEDAQEVTFSNVDRIDAELKRRVLLFDWWVRNEDRSLTEFGGNPNLLRAAGDGSLRVFDLNLAFDDSFNEVGFWKSHVFNRSVPSWPDDFKVEMTERMRAALAMLPGIWQELPGEWLERLSDKSHPGALSLDTVKQVLERFQTSPDEFWTVRR
jgi:hypothetical protein